MTNPAGVTRTRILLISAAVILSMAALAWLLINMLIGRIRPTLESKLSELLGLAVRIEAVRLQIVPFPSLELSNLGVDFGPHCRNAVTVRHAFLRVSLEALLEKRIEIGLARVLEPKIAAAIDPESGKPLGPSGALCRIPEPPATVSAPVPAASLTLPLLGTIQAPEINLEIARLEVLQGAISLNYGERSLTCEDANLYARVAVDTTSFSLNDISLAALCNSQPLSLSISELRRNPDGSYALMPSQIEVAGDKLTINGQVLLSSGSFLLSAKTNSLDLEKLLTLSGWQARGQLSGTRVAFDLKLTAPERHKFAAEGSLGITGLDLPGQQLKAAKISFPAIRLNTLERRLMSLTGEAQVSDLSVVDKQDRYGLRTASLKFSLIPASKPRYTISATADVQGFAFEQPELKIQEASAILRDIRALIDSDGGVTVKLNVDGKTILLDHPAVTVRGMQSLTAPLVIEVPARGGYRIAGPVNIQKASVTPLGRPLEDISGVVEMSISSASKSFKTQNLSANANKQLLAVKTSFEMTPTAYFLQPTQLLINRGSIKVNGEMGRGAASQVQLSLAAADVSLPHVLNLAAPQVAADYAGQISRFDLSLKASRTNFISSLVGSGSLLLVQQETKRFDLGRAIGQALALIPIVGGKLSPASFKDDTRNNSFSAGYSIRDRVVTLSKVRIQRTQYTLEGNATVGFDLYLRGKGNVIFLQQTFSALGGGYKTLGNLLGLAGRVSVPLILEGQIPNISVSPDMILLGKKLSGLGLAESLLNTTLGAGETALGIVTRPFRRSDAQSSVANASSSSQTDQ